MPKVSVIMATYSKDKLEHLKQSINSIFAQTLEDFEYIIVIDGQIPQEAELFLKNIKDSRVTILKLEENKGPAKARNIGIERANGQYIAIQDADDVSDKYRLEKQYAYLLEHNLDLVGSCVNQIDDNGNFVKRKTYPIDKEKIVKLMPYINTINNSAVFCKAFLLRTLPYDEKVRFGEDYRTWIRAIKSGFQLGNHPEHLVAYRLSSFRRRGWQTAIVDMKIKLAALSITIWYLWPAVILAAGATAVFRMTPNKIIIYIYRVKEFFLPKLARF